MSADQSTPQNTVNGVREPYGRRLTWAATVTAYGRVVGRHPVLEPAKRASERGLGSVPCRPAEARLIGRRPSAGTARNASVAIVYNRYVVGSLDRYTWPEARLRSL